jgi:hypothetical protein
MEVDDFISYRDVVFAPRRNNLKLSFMKPGVAQWEAAQLDRT